MARLIVIGDIHGCLDEVRDLLRVVQPAVGDRVVSVGDFVSKGPDVAGTVELWRTHSFEAVLGNNEDKFLEAVRRGPEAVNAANARLGERPDLVAWLRALPVQVDADDFNVSIVHAGMAPPSIESSWVPAEVRETRLRLRHLRRGVDGKWVRVKKGEESATDTFWTDLWQETRTVVYGHTPLSEAAVRANSVGIDTGCVYGGALTAAIFSSIVEAPQLVSVPARRAYAARR